VLLRPRSSNRDDNLRRPRDSLVVATKALPAIGWSSSPRQRAEGLSSTPSPRRASGRRVRRSPPTKLRLRRESKENKHVCFTAAYRIQSGRLVSRVSLLVRETLRSSGAESPNKLTSNGPSFIEKNIPVDLAQGISVYPAKSSSKPAGSEECLEQRLHIWCTPGVPHLP
jgi:hypothetical protein